MILDHNIENNAKQIKMLELSIQHGEESKVDYNPIDRLVGIYYDIMSTHLLSVEEYARSTNESEADVKKRMEVAKLMVEFLEFINAPEQFHIARDLQLYFPLEELTKLMKKCSSEDEMEDLKIAVFTNVLMQPAGDMTRFVRNIKPIIGSEYQEEFLEEQKTLAAEMLDSLPEQGKVDTTVIRESVRANEELVHALGNSVEKAMTKVKKNETRNRPVQLAEKAATFLESIDPYILLKMNDSELKRMSRQLDKLEQIVAEIRGNL